MTAPGYDVDAIRELGYNDAEAHFLYLVATHSGHFTRSQFLKFTGLAKSPRVHRFTTKALHYRDVRATEYGRQTYIFNLYSRRIYAAIDKDYLRSRRPLSTELLHTRLLILDFVLGHLNHEYLETAAQKVAHFHRNLGIPLSVLPGRIYHNLKPISNTKRYFVDRSPIFLAPGPDSSPGLSVPTFAYCDPAETTLAGFINHLGRYESLLSRFSAFNFIYASSTSAKFDRAAKFFQSRFGQTGALIARDVVRYFQIRQLWESHKTSSLTPADRDALRTGDQRYCDERFQSAYARWTAGTLSESELDAVLDACNQTQNRSFTCYVLPNSYAIFHRRSLSQLRPSLRSRWSPDAPSGSSTCGPEQVPHVRIEE